MEDRRDMGGNKPKRDILFWGLPQQVGKFLINHNIVREYPHKSNNKYKS
jgi:hypothetical protein